MFTKTIVAALAAAPAIVSAGNAIVKNNCASAVNGWSVAINRAEKINIAPGESYSEAYFTPTFGGVSMKLSYLEQDDPYEPFGMTQFEYTLAGSELFYDISNINGYPFVANGITLVPGESSCPTKTCPAGQEKCGDAYNVPNDDHATGACSAGTDTTLYLCSTDDQASAPKKVAAPVAAAPVAAAAKVDTPAAPAKVDTPAAPAKVAAPAAAKKVEKPAPAPAAPKVTAAPVAAPAPAPDAGVFTTFVTQIVTVIARDAAPEPTAVPAKRDAAEDQMVKRANLRLHRHRHNADSN